MSAPANVRLISHGSGRGPSTLPGGGSPSNASGTVVDLPANSAQLQVLTANGWSRIGLSGTTAQRPTNMAAGEHYVDLTLNKVIVFDGVQFKDPVTGSTV